MPKPKKTRNDKYDNKLAIKGNFEDVIKVSVGKQPVKPKQEDTPKTKAKK